MLLCNYIANDDVVGVGVDSRKSGIVTVESLFIGGLNRLFIKSLANSIAAGLVEYAKSS
jgi:hypothetical protein